MKTFNYVFGVTILLIVFSFSTRAQIITTIAGDSTEGYNGDNILAITAELDQPIGVAVDGAGNIYICDHYNNRVRKVTTSGIITTIAGTGVIGYTGDGGFATNATLNIPYGVAVDNLGNVYFSDGYNECIRKIDTMGIITTIAGNNALGHGYNGDNIPATAATLYSPSGIVIDSAKNIYIADVFNNRVRKINSLGIITTIGGNGSAVDSGNNTLATEAGIYLPNSLALDKEGNIYVGEQGGYLVRKINSSGIISNIAGNDTDGYRGDNGPATMAELSRILGIAVDAAGNIFLSDADNNRIRQIDPAGIISTYAGDGDGDYNGDGIPASAAQLAPAGLALDGSGNLYIGDVGNNRIRHITSALQVSNVNSSRGILNLYPNPTDGMLNINLSQSINERAEVTITDITGEIIKDFEVNTNAPMTITLNERSGVYLITIKTQSGIYTNKLVIEK